MNPEMLTTTLFAVAVVGSLVAWAAFSLRDFSRSRIEELCRRSGRDGRFREILMHYEDILLVLESLYALLLAASGGLVWALVASAGIDAARRTMDVVLAVAAWLGLGVLLPWILARVAGEWYVVRTWILLTALRTLAQPALWLARQLDRMAHRIAGVEPLESGDREFIADEIRTVVDEGQREGALQSEAQQMIHRVIEFHEVDVKEIMTPRTRMVCVQADDALDSARKMLIEEGHSRVPVIGKSPDDVLGVLYAKDLLQHLTPQPDAKATLADIAREPFFVPETMSIDTLLKTFKRGHVHLAIVLDEYGGVAGIVTMEDVLEEIVGEIADEYDESAPLEPIRAVAPGVHEVDARLHLDDVNERLQLQLPTDGDYDTIGGFAFSLLGRIPRKGEQFSWEQVRFVVVDADSRTIHRLRIEVDVSSTHASAE